MGLILLEALLALVILVSGRRKGELPVDTPRDSHPSPDKPSPGQDRSGP